MRVGTRAAVRAATSHCIGEVKVKNKTFTKPMVARSIVGIRICTAICMQGQCGDSALISRATVVGRWQLRLCQCHVVY